MQKLLIFLSTNISVYAIFDDQNFNDTLTNDIVSFEQLGPHYENMLIQILKFFPRRGGSNEYHNLCFLSRNKKNNVYPCKPQFYYIKVGFKGVKII